MTRVAAVLKVRPGEGRTVWRVLLMMVLGWIGFAVGGNAVESLLFARFGTEVVPILYLIAGPLTCVVLLGMSAYLAPRDPRAALGRVPLLLAGVVLASRAVLLLDARWLYPALWLVMLVTWTVYGIASWGIASALHDTRQAKRLFPLYGAGLIVGSSAGGFLTRPLAAWLHAENLFFVWAVALAAAWVAILPLATRPVRGRVRRRTGAGTLRQLLDGGRDVARSPLLRWMALALGLFALLYYTLALLLARAATARFPDADDLAGFLGVFMGAAAVGALLVSLLLANRLFARFGIAAMVLVLPVIYLVGFSVLTVSGTFATLVGFRFAQMVWVNGVWGTGWQALFNVVPPESRSRVRAFMDGGPLQAGVVASGVLLLVADELPDPRTLSIIGAAAAAVAVAAIWRARRAYSGALVHALRSGRPDVFLAEDEPFGGFRHDGQALDAARRAAADPNPAVRRVAVEILAGVRLPETADALRAAVADEDPDVRAAALLGLVGADVDADPGRLRDLLDDADSRVRAHAAAALLPDAAARDVLTRLAGDRDAQTRKAAIVAAAARAAERPLVEAGLDDPDPAVRRLAAGSLAAYGASAVGALVDRLDDRDGRLRRAVAEALADIGAAAIPVLLEALENPRRERAALLALSRLPVAEPERLGDYARREVGRATRFNELRLSVPSDGDGRVALLADALRHRAEGHAVGAIRALMAFGERAALELVVENLASRDAAQRANALETLEASADPAFVRPLLATWEVGPRTRTDASGGLLELLRDEDAWLRACAAYAAASVASPAVRDRVRVLAREDPDALVREAAAATLDGAAMQTLSTLTVMDRVLFLRGVPLFADLDPGDLRYVAEAATEQAYPDGERIAEQGEAGDEMHIVVSGEIRVLAGEREIARRRPGDYVGEMAILSEAPRMAALVAAGEVRTLSIDRRRFQRIVEDRPQVSLAVMRVLCDRLRERDEPS